MFYNKRYITQLAQNGRLFTTPAYYTGYKDPSNVIKSLSRHPRNVKTCRHKHHAPIPISFPTPRDELEFIRLGNDFLIGLTFTIKVTSMQQCRNFENERRTGDGPETATVQDNKNSSVK